MKKFLFIAVLLTIGCRLPAIHAASIGTWKAYMAYHDVTEIEKGGNVLYILASDNLYSYNQNDQSIRTFDKVNALSDCDINHIAWSNSAKRLVIIYKNFNIDLLDEKGTVTNVSDYYSKSLTADKTIYGIYMSDAYAYLATGFGIIKLNVRNAEISDTYSLGFRVDYCYIQGSNIYAASSTNGLYSAALNDNLLDKNNWNRVGEYVHQSKTIDPELLAIAETLDPGGPKYNYFGFLKFYNNKLYSCGGGFSSATDLHRNGCIQVLEGDEWDIYEDDIISKTGHNYLDLAALDIDPKDATHVFAGGRTGLYEFRNSKFVKEYTYENSPLQGAKTVSPTNKDYTIVQGLTFDGTGNLWCLNSISATTSLLEYASGEWTSHHKAVLMADDVSFENMKSAVFDSRNLLWFVNDHYREPGLVCYQPSTDAIKVYKSFTNEDGTTISNTAVSCVIEDRDRNIWFGTAAGPLLLEQDEIGNDDPLFTQVKVPRNDGTNYADYLLSGVGISCIAIDGGGRKWFGTTSNGVYLISEDNMTQLQHFTAENSYLLSDNIESIAINNQTGEVFFGTDKGLCSYMSDATATNEEMTKDNVYAYPNPVRPGYSGLITVTGLSYNADVKIVTTNGVLVAKGRSNGGTFTWDGCDLNGKRVASGVYMVETATQDGGSGTVCKIAVVN
ncbi:MAG: Por secretion system protein [Prevotella sp.]|nr:Por secretion system protein [Prevotella sp.]